MLLFSKYNCTFNDFLFTFTRVSLFGIKVFWRDSFHVEIVGQLGQSPFIHILLLTDSAASLMNCLAASFQMAGTVRTQWMSSLLNPSAAIVFSEVFMRSSFRYLIDRENTLFAGSFLPVESSSKMLRSIPCLNEKYTVKFIYKLPFIYEFIIQT